MMLNLSQVASRQQLTLWQIRVIRDTHAHEKGNKKIKPHRGYAFVVFEREKDMRGKPSHPFDCCKCFSIHDNIWSSCWPVLLRPCATTLPASNPLYGKE